MSRKASISVIWMLILGFLIFIIVSCSIGNGALKAFNSYKSSEKTLDKLMDASKEMSTQGNNVKLTLVNLKMETNTAIYVFTDKDILIENRNAALSGPFRKAIIKPLECTGYSNCICLCKDYSLEAADENKAEEIKTKYGADYAYNIICGKAISCFSLAENPADKIFQETTELEKIVDPVDYPKLKSSLPVSWDGGFAFARTEESIEFTELVRTTYVDLYVIKNADNTIGYCFTPDCVN